MHVNMHEAKTQLSRLVEAVSRGERVVIAKAGRPCAELVPYKHRTKPRTPGNLKGQIWMAEDFDELPRALIDSFYDGPIEP